MKFAVFGYKTKEVYVGGRFQKTKTGEARLWPWLIITPVVLVWLITWILTIGFIGNNVIGEGEAYGHVTAIETGGLIWSTTEVFIKTDLESTQEDVYCVKDPAIIRQLSEAAANDYDVRISFINHLGFGDGCEFGASNTIISVDRM